MKRFIIAAFSLIVQIASAKHNEAVLNLRMNDNSPFEIRLDGKPYFSNGPTLQIAGLRAGEHRLEVFQPKRFRYELQMMHAFSGFVVLTANAESFVTVHGRRGQVTFDRIVAFAPRRPQLPPPAPVCPSVQPEFYPAGPIGPQPMNAYDFSQLKHTIAQANFESTKLNIFRQALAYNNFTSQQVLELMDVFWFESSKLEVAKLAYDRTVDRNNYYIVNNGFSFSSSVNQLSDYVAMR